MPDRKRIVRQGATESVINEALELEALPGVNQLPAGATHSRLGHLPRSEYVSALALSNSGEAMIIERPHIDGAMASWQVIGGAIRRGEDPMAAVERTLLETTGYISDQWFYMGSYVGTESDYPHGVGHFFCAFDAQQVAPSQLPTGEEGKVRWVSQRDLRLALLDGRIHVLSYAITISMALLTVLE